MGAAFGTTTGVVAGVAGVSAAFVVSLAGVVGGGVVDDADGVAAVGDGADVTAGVDGVVAVAGGVDGAVEMAVV
ncbi:MAG: RNA polymerase subunit sigma-24, partial [Casimicrobiaceae bacterium]